MILDAELCWLRLAMFVTHLPLSMGRFTALNI